MSTTKALVPVDHIPGSKPLKIAKYERYARYRAQALPRMVAFRKIGNFAANDKVAHRNATRLTKRPGIKDRIAYLSRQEEQLITAKRRRLEEFLWSVHESSIQDLFTTEDQINPTGTTNNPAEIANNSDQQKAAVSPRVRVVPRLLTDLPPELAALIEDVAYDSKGRLVPRLYSKVQASRELRAMLNISARSEAPDVTKLSDAELISQLRDQAKQLGIEINLNYHFAQQPPVTVSDDQDGRVIDIENENGTPAQALAEVQSLSPPNTAEPPTQQSASGKPSCRKR
jgi:hypothetical protein